MKKLTLVAALTATTFLATPIVAATTVSAGVVVIETQSAIDEINAKYAVEYDRIENEATALSENAPDPSTFEAAVNFEFDVTWETTSIKFDIPEVTMQTHKFSLHLPQFKMKRIGVSWDNPEVRMVLRVVGKYPCFRGFKWYSCDIKTKVPEVHMVRREAKFDVPEVYWDKTSFSMDIPEFHMKTIEFKLDLPQFELQDVKGQFATLEDEANALSAEATVLAQAQKGEIASVVASDLSLKREEVAAQFDIAITTMEASIVDIRNAGADPTALISDEGTVDLIAMLNNLKLQRAETLNLLSDKVAEYSS